MNLKNINSFSKISSLFCVLIIILTLFFNGIFISAQEEDKGKSFGDIRDEVVDILDLEDNNQIDNSEEVSDSNDVIIDGDKIELTEKEIQNLEIQCNQGLIGRTTRCSFEIPKNKKLPENFKLSVGQVDPNGECVLRLDGDGIEIQVCDNIPVTENEGQQDIFVQTESESEPISLNKNIEVTRVASEFEPARITQLNSTRSLFCSPRSVKNGGTVDCGGSLPSTITPPLNGLFLKAGDNGKSVKCVFDSTDPGASYECLDLVVNSASRNISILGSVNGQNFADTGYKVVIEENKENLISENPKNPKNLNNSDLIDTVRTGGETTLIAIITISALIVGFYFWDKKRKSGLRSEYKRIDL